MIFYLLQIFRIFTMVHLINRISLTSSRHSLIFDRNCPVLLVFIKKGICFISICFISISKRIHLMSTRIKAIQNVAFALFRDFLAMLAR